MPAEHRRLSDRKMSHSTWKTRYRSLRKGYTKAEATTSLRVEERVVTATREEDIPVRRFFLGEIFRTRLSRVGGGRGLQVQDPWLVTRKQSLPGHPIQMAPSSRCPRECDWIFSTSGNGAEFHFLLYYRRPVYREQIVCQIGALDGKEKQRLAAEFQSVLGVVS